MIMGLDFLRENRGSVEGFILREEEFVVVLRVVVEWGS